MGRGKCGRAQWGARYGRAQVVPGRVGVGHGEPRQPPGLSVPLARMGGTGVDEGADGFGAECHARKGGWQRIGSRLGADPGVCTVAREPRVGRRMGRLGGPIGGSGEWEWPRSGFGRGDWEAGQETRPPELL